MIRPFLTRFSLYVVNRIQGFLHQTAGELRTTRLAVFQFRPTCLRRLECVLLNIAAHDAQLSGNTQRFIDCASRAALLEAEFRRT